MDPSSKPESGLEVRKTPEYSWPQHIPTDTPKEAAYCYGPTPASTQYTPQSTEVFHGQHIAPNAEGFHSQASLAKERPRDHHLSSPLLLFIGALISGLIVGAALGGGLGSRLHMTQVALRQCQQANATTLSTLSNSTGLLIDYVAAKPSKILSLDFTCNDGAVWESTYGEKFLIGCNIARITNGGDGSYSGMVVAYTLDDCMQACSALNYWGTTLAPCKYIEFHPAMALNTNDGFSNCVMLTGINMTMTARPTGGPEAGGASAAITRIDF